MDGGDPVATRPPGRPPASTRSAVERVAIALMLADGYGAVTVDQVAAAAGIGRTTFFRYFRSKAAVVWGAFDEAIERLAAALDASPASTPVVEAVMGAVVESTRRAAQDSDVWLERFALLDNSPALRAEAAEHWTRWTAAVTSFVTPRTSPPGDGVVAAAVAGAVQGTYLATLRGWRTGKAEPEALLRQLGTDLTRVGGALQALVSGAGAPLVQPSAAATGS